jgi:hypothetical protein
MNCDQPDLLINYPVLDRARGRTVRAASIGRPQLCVDLRSLDSQIAGRGTTVSLTSMKGVSGDRNAYINDQSLN